jgi:hypothetical protein
MKIAAAMTQRALGALPCVERHGTTRIRLLRIMAFRSLMARSQFSITASMTASCFSLLMPGS